MQRIFTFFLAAVVMMHTALGCCVHHAHSCEVDCCDAPAPTAASCPCDGHDHEEEGEPAASEFTGNSTHDRDSHRCEGEACTLAALDRTDSDLDDGSQPVAIVCCVADANVAVRAATTAEHGNPQGAISSAPHLHLVLSILLI